MPYKNPVDRARASKRYYWRKKYRDEGLEFDPAWDSDQLKENYHRLQLSEQISQNEKEQVFDKKGEKQVQERIFAYDNPVVHEMPISPDNYSGGVDDFFLVQVIAEEKQQEIHWSGLSAEARERISEGTAPLLFDRDVDLLPVVADFEVYLEDMKVKKIEDKENIWRFI